MSGATEGIVWKRQTFHWYPPWLLALSFIPLLMAVAVPSMTKRADGELPFTEAAWRTRQRVQLLRALSLLMVVLSIIVGACVLSTSRPILMGLAATLLLVGGIGIGYRFVWDRVPAPRKITDDAIELEIPSEIAARAFWERLYGSRHPQA